MKGKPTPLEANRRYHDRVAPRYDDIYKGPRWDAWYELSWDGLKPHIPADLRAPIADLGCGTGRYGLRLARSGYQVTFSDLSLRMLETARRKAEDLGIADRCLFQQADIVELGELPGAPFALAIAQGDVLSFAASPPRALKQIRRLLRPGGVLVASVDQTYAALEHYATKPDLEGMQHLVQRGEMEWLAHDPSERFPVHTFSAEQLKDLIEKAGLELLDLYGKTVLPFKKLEAAFEDSATARKNSCTGAQALPEAFRIGLGESLAVCRAPSRLSRMPRRYQSATRTSAGSLSRVTILRNHGGQADKVWWRLRGQHSLTRTKCAI
ncbi:MAG: class I SAM-dependent methyltransferase [Planctomycetota bacterium]|nr:class I SAM-dependent methyltransferase [Planctomycetota bacterium]